MIVYHIKRIERIYANISPTIQLLYYARNAYQKRGTVFIEEKRSGIECYHI
jgi:hypothetical protein